MSRPDISTTPAWQALAAHAATTGDAHLRDLFAADPERGTRLVAEVGDLYVDYSKNGSKRYCDSGNCGNRMNVNAYRRRRGLQESA